MNDARPSPGARLCPLDALGDPGSRGFSFIAGETRFAGFVVRHAETLAGYVDTCPHARWPLAWREHDYLTRARDLILCSGHGALFRAVDGVCIAGPCAGAALTPWPVAVSNGWIVVV